MLEAYPGLGLRLERHLDVIPKEGKAPLLCLFSFSRGAGQGEPLPALTVRDAKGAWTSEFRAVRDAMGMPSMPP
jgi:tRNA1(Val) A37 N6-methylase TrmN6